MANWQYTLDIKDEYKEARAETLQPHEMAHRIATKIRALPVHSIYDIINQFEALSEGATFDDTDEIMEQLYDWGNQWVGPGRADKKCWISTF